MINYPFYLLNLNNAVPSNTEGQQINNDNKKIKMAFRCCFIFIPNVQNVCVAETHKP